MVKYLFAIMAFMAMLTCSSIASTKYDPLIKDACVQFQSEALPDNFAWHKARIQAESDFNPVAVSHAGAMGLCQFMSFTAKAYGIDPFKPEECIPGMVRYTNDIYSYFFPQRDVDWNDPNTQMLIDAGYNTGQGRVKRLCRLYGYSFEAIKWRVALETRQYAPRIQRYKEVYLKS